MNELSISVVIPAYRVRDQILSVLAKIDSSVSKIYVVDDHCPEKSGAFVTENSTDPRVKVLFNPVNLGVGGATLNGFQQAMLDGADILVKIDGDGQMNPAHMHNLVNVLRTSQADYVKGNRFYHPDELHPMPLVRLLGNTGLSFLTKISSGYWNIFDPTNGYIAMSAKVFKLLPLAKIDKRYFFESDLLFRLNIMRAVVVDVPLPVHYGDEKSSLNPFKEFFRFAVKNTKNIIKRIIYTYFIRDFNVASLELIASIFLLVFGTLFGTYHWLIASAAHQPATAGTVMLAALPIIVGMQFFLSFLQYDIAMVPRESLQKKLQ
jgi:dolichol-phosphate mannosyltransferase